MNNEKKELMDVRDYLGIRDSHDKLDRCLWREEKYNNIMTTLEDMKRDLDSLLEKDSMEPVTAEEIDALFEETGSADMSLIEKI